MLLQGSGSVFLTIVYILVATILLWIMLYLASRIIVSKSYASDKKIILLLAALVLVIAIPFVRAGAAWLFGILGDALASLRNLIDNGGQNYVTNLVPIIVYLVFIAILKFLCGMDWRDTVWVSLLGLLLLYMLYSLVPELDFMGGLI